MAEDARSGLAFVFFVESFAGKYRAIAHLVRDGERSTPANYLATSDWHSSRDDLTAHCNAFTRWVLECVRERIFSVS